MIKLETLQIVGEYQGKPTLDMYANMLNQVGREYGNAMLVVENNNTKPSGKQCHMHNVR